MKKLVFFVAFFGVFITSLCAQISGGFYNQNGAVCFVGQNVSGYVLNNLTINCVNAALNQRTTLTLNFLANGASFSVGPTEGWMWQPGEQLYVTFANGQTVYWTFQPVTPSYTVPDNSYSPSSSNNNLVIQEEIRQLESKIKDAERSLSLYQEWHDKNPTSTNARLITEQRRLIQTYQNRIQDLYRRMR